MAEGDGSMRAEMAYYRDHAHEGRDEASLADLRERCAALVSDQLGVVISADELVSVIRFQAYPDAAPALRELVHAHDIPCLTTYKAKGVLDEDDERCIGALALSPKADAIAAPPIGSATRCRASRLPACRCSTSAAVAGSCASRWRDWEHG